MRIQCDPLLQEACTLVNDVLACSPIVGFFIFVVRRSQFKQDVKSLRGQVNRLTDKSSTLKKKSSEAVDSAENLTAALKRGQQLIERSKRAQKLLSEKLDQKGKELKGNLQTQSLLDVSIAELNKEIKQIDIDLKEVAEISDKIDRESKEVSKENSEIGHETDTLGENSEDFNIQLRKVIQQHNRNLKHFIVSLLTTTASIVSMVALTILSVKFGVLSSSFLGLLACSAYSALDNSKFKYNKSAT